MTGLDVLKRARQIAADGGVDDPLNCELSPFCARCCIARAKSLLDHETGGGVGSLFALAEVLADKFTEQPEDAALVEARKAVAKYDDGIKHDKPSLLALFDVLIEDLSPVEQPQ